MLPNEWAQMGGDSCFQTGSCENCAASEWGLVKKIGQTQADKVFLEHWSTWFTETDVQNIANAGLNTVRIPVRFSFLPPCPSTKLRNSPQTPLFFQLGFWIIEDLVNRTTEFYVSPPLRPFLFTVNLDNKKT